MINEIKDVMAYILQKYPTDLTHELSNARVTKMIYLADWHFAIHHKRQITNIEWYFDTYGPFVKDIEATARGNTDIFVIDYGNNRHGRPNKTFSLKDRHHTVDLDDDVKASLNLVIEVTKGLYWSDFIKHIYSSFPVKSSERYTYLDLKKFAKQFRKERDALKKRNEGAV